MIQLQCSWEVYQKSQGNSSYRYLNLFLHCYKPSRHRQQGTRDKWVSKETYEVEFYSCLKKKLWCLGNVYEHRNIMLRETSQSQEKRYHAHFPSKEQEKTMKNKRGGWFFRKVGRSRGGGRRKQKGYTGMTIIKSLYSYKEILLQTSLLYIMSIF